MHSKSENTEFQTFNNVNDVADELLKSLLSMYWHNLEISMRGSNFIQFNCCITNVTRQILDVMVDILILQIG